MSVIDPRSQEQTFVIAEIGQAHDGSLGILHSYIDAVAGTGANAIKFQMHVADAESSRHEPFRAPFSYEDVTRQDYWRRMEFSLEQWVGIRKHCEAVGLEFMSTPSCVTAVDWLEQLDVRRYKIGSGDTSNHLLLRRVADTRKQVILSTGLSSIAEIDGAVGLLTEAGVDLIVMQCTSEYPVRPERIGLNQLEVFRTRYSRPVGLSDHSGTPYPCLAAVALGATCVEIHVAFDRRMFGPDSRASLTIDELMHMVHGIRIIEAALTSSFDKAPLPDQTRTREIFGKTLSLRRDMKAGDAIAFSDLESKKPAGLGIPAADFANVVGKTLKRNVVKWDFLREEDIG